MAEKRTKQTRGAGSLRIIGGQWRGRRLPIADLPGLRPTGDRLRETLFNWLAAEVPGARCLDLFAGTGALGLEALSRGGAHCDFVERNATAAALLCQALKTLDAESRGSVAAADFAAFLERQDVAGNYNIVFLDPPFGQGLLESAAAYLERNGVLAEDALVYVEHEAEAQPQWPAGWKSWRARRTQTVVYAVYRVHGSSVEETDA